MKTRLGFVSNSSSSSFIVGIKGCNLNEESIVKALKVPEDSTLHMFSKQLAHFIAHRSREVTSSTIIENYGCTDFAEALTDQIPEAELIAKGFKVYSVECSYNESDDVIETFIGNGGLADMETDALAFKTVS